jgi:hypothetical protein
MVKTASKERRMPRSLDEALPPELTEDIRGMELDEMTASGQYKIELALDAASVARFLWRFPWPTEAVRRAAFVLAERACRVANLCISQPRPGGRA